MANVVAIERMPSSDVECRAADLGYGVPCPFVRCRHHLSIDVTTAGSLRVLFPHWHDSVPDNVPTCSLAEARKGAHSVAEVAAIFGTSQRRILEIERSAWAKIRKAMDDGREK
jgi:hypothetical protein